MHIFQALILGIVEGLTEFLPVSSTGHLIIAAKLLGLPNTNFLNVFEIVIQVGAILAVVVLYFKKFLDIEILKKVVVGFIPTAIIGLIFYKFVKNFLGSTDIVLWAMFLGGLIIVIFELLKRDNREVENGVKNLTYKQCVIIGLFQSVAIIPGVSRSGATIIGGLSIGIDRKTITEYSFLIAVPTMIAASGLELIKGAGGITTNEFGLIAFGFLVAFVVAIVAVKSFIGFIRHHKFTGFGIYRIIASVFFFFLVG